MRIGRIYNPAAMAELLRQTIADNVARRAVLTRAGGTSLSQVSAGIRRAAAQAQAQRRAMFHLDITV